jgi:hypothetical protein
LRHHVCESCGKYRNREVLDVNAANKRQEARKKRKMKELGLDPKSQSGERKDRVESVTEDEPRAAIEPKPLDAAALSKKT